MGGLVTTVELPSKSAKRISIIKCDIRVGPLATSFAVGGQGHNSSLSSAP